MSAPPSVKHTVTTNYGGAIYNGSENYRLH